MTDQRPKTIPELRGFSTVPRERTRAYYPASYCVQYGIPLELAEELVEYHGCAGNDSHAEIERDIVSRFARDPELKRRALGF